MKITIISEFFPWSEDGELRGGVEARAYYFAQELAQQHQVTVITSHEPETTRQGTIGRIKVIRVGKKRIYSQGGSIFSRLCFIKEAKKVCQDLEADIIDGYNWICHLAVWFSRSKAKKVATYHDVWLGSWISNLGLFSGVVGEIMEKYIISRNWDLFIANSQTTKAKLIDHRVNADKVQVVYNGVDLDAFASNDDFIPNSIIYIGRLVSYKNVDQLLQAVKIVKNDIPEIKLSIIGSGPKEAELKKLARELNLDSNVTFLGFVRKHQEVIDRLKKSQIFCLPSSVEGFGMVTIEALAASVPYVNSDIKPTIEITQNGKGGLLYPTGQVEKLASSLQQLLSDPELYRQKRQEGGELVQSYGWPKLAVQLNGIYQSL
ncbi:glycosyltransferase family 4 protein [Patescibacteria group bacterium]|nr:glycosyltransferase family 4 protein [Patescibacteria group bacterium]